MKALYEAIVKKYIIFPTSVADLQNVINGFELPQCAGAMDGCFIPIRRPSGPFGSRYWCYKSMDAIILLAVVDSDGRFMWIQVGNPGCVGDAACFNCSELKANIESGEWLPQSAAADIDGIMVSPFLISDSAFTQCPYLLKNMSASSAWPSLEYCYNFCHIRTRRIVENAFGMLKARFEICRKTNSTNPRFMSAVVAVCCALHNMCIQDRLPLEGDWVANIPVLAQEQHEHGQAVPGSRVESIDAEVMQRHLGEWCRSNVDFARGQL